MIWFCIPVHNRLSYTIKCIESIMEQSCQDFKIIIADSASTDRTSETIREQYPGVKVIETSDSMWWTGATNICVKEALLSAGDDDYIFTLNNDTELSSGAIETLLKAAQKNASSIIGAVNVFYADHEKIEPSAFKRDSHALFFKKFHYPVNKWGESFGNRSGLLPVDTLSGKGVLIPVRAFRQVGLYNEELLPHYHADTEFIIRCKNAGFSVSLCYDAVIYSHQELSGSGTKTSNPGLKSFLKSITDLKSANHLASNRNVCRLIYGKYWRLYFYYGSSRMIFGFLRRYTTGFITKR